MNTIDLEKIFWEQIHSGSSLEEAKVKTLNVCEIRLSIIVKDMLDKNARDYFLRDKKNG